MADAEDIRLQRMGLVELPACGENEVLGEEDFTQRLDLYNKLKDSHSLITKFSLETKLLMKPPNIPVTDNVSPATYQFL